MFQYQNHRFYWEQKVSFQIPDGYFFDSEPGEESDNFMRLWSPDEDFSVWIYVTEDCVDTEEAILDVLEDIEPKWNSEIQPISVDGLQGHHAFYYMSSPQYYEAWLQIDCDKALTIIIESEHELLDVDTQLVMKAIDIKKRV